MYYVYAATNLQNAFQYISITNNFKRTRQQMLSNLRAHDTTKVNIHLLSDFIKYGEQAFEWEILATVETRREAQRILLDFLWLSTNPLTLAPNIYNTNIPHPIMA